MFTRYPHTGIIRTITENEQTDGISEFVTADVNIKGRFEPTSQNKNIDYSAKFYCKTVDVEGFEVDGHQFIYNGKQFKIVQLFNYQTHCEIWLE